MALTNEPVTVICYGKEEKYNSRQEAYDFYIQGAIATEGSEQSRYVTICSMLKCTNDKVVGDDQYYNKNDIEDQPQEEQELDLEMEWLFWNN